MHYFFIQFAFLAEKSEICDAFKRNFINTFKYLREMTKSALQIARAAYQPKLPKGLTGTVKAVAGAATQSVADQEEIKKLFPNTYGMPLIKFENTDETVDFPAMNVGVILSGGQAPGGHNVISGILTVLKS